VQQDTVRAWPDWIAHVRTLETGWLSAKDMTEPIQQRVTEIDPLGAEQKARRQKRMDHNGWFKTQPGENHEPHGDAEKSRP
jgi:hypothetical protein